MALRRTRNWDDDLAEFAQPKQIPPPPKKKKNIIHDENSKYVEIF
jgi:hypothetical protein